MSETVLQNDHVAGPRQVERQQLIYRLALKHGAVDVSDLAQRLDVTTETIRRDLAGLQERQLVRRVHGGAVLVEQHHHEPMLDARDMLNAAEKLEIGRLAAALLPEQGTVIIDSGSTGLRLAQVMPVDRPLQVLTNSLVTAMTLARRGLQDLTVLGGSVRTNTLAMIDADTVTAVRSMRVDVLFISCDGLSFHRGLTTPYRQEQQLKRAMIDSARRVVALVDRSKFGNDQTYCFAELDDIDTLVTDAGASDDQIAILREAGIDVHRA